MQRTANAQLALRQPVPRPPTVLDIINATCKVHGVAPSHLVGPRKHRHLSRPRQLAMHLCREMCPRLSFPMIARRFYRDHTSVLYACRQADILLERDPEFRARRDQVLRELAS